MSNINEENKHLWSQFCRLGEMIGDGLHYEDRSISVEYKRLLKILIPETEEEKNYKRKLRKLKNTSINEQLIRKLERDRCTCGGELKQIRSGSKTVKCTIENCGKKYKYKSKKS